MKPPEPTGDRRSPRTAARWALVLCLALSSCRTMSQPELSQPEPPVDDAPPVMISDEPAADVGPSLERIPTGTEVARAVEATEPVPAAPLCQDVVPLPMCNIPPWTPPGISGPWPHDEYLEDGGDNFIPVNVNSRGELQGLELEDTVAVYDTIDGQTKIKPSNTVCLYAPRFAAVRHVASVIENLQNDQLVAVGQPVMPAQSLDDSVPTTAVQPVQPEGEISTKQPSIERRQELPTPTISLQPILAVDHGAATYEDLLVMHKGIFDESQRPRLIESIDAAIAWTHDKAVQVVLDGRAAVDVTGDQRAQATFRVDVPNNPCLRIIKIASKKTAKPGEIVDFTIRFDNTGDQRITKVVLIDNLTTRLEYVPQTAQSSRAAEFSTQANDGDSLTLRWDFVEPLLPGEGGLVRFNCRVR